MNNITGILIHYIIFAVIWYAAQTFGCLFLFAKTGSKKSLAFVPVLREKVLFDISVKNEKLGLVWLILAVVGLVLCRLLHIYPGSCMDRRCCHRSGSYPFHLPQLQAGQSIR